MEVEVGYWEVGVRLPATMMIAVMEAVDGRKVARVLWMAEAVVLNRRSAVSTAD